MTGENGITRQSVQQLLISNPQLAQELGAFFAAERSTTLQTKSLGTFNVHGEDNGVLYGRLGSRDVSERMAGNIDMVPGNVYTLQADGEVDENNWFGGERSPTDTDDGRTKLQVAVIDSSGNVIDRQNYRPGMQISTDVEGARLGFIYADSRLDDNSGNFNVNVRETSATQQSTNVLFQSDGIDYGPSFNDAFETAPGAASLPEPDPSLSGPGTRGLQTNGNEISTPDGYRFQFEGNQVRIDWPGRLDDGSAETLIDGRNVTEADGTAWTAESGNYVLPNGALFTLGYGDNGQLNNFTLVNGDSRVDVSGIGAGNPRVGNVRDGGIEYRRRAVEDNYGGSTYRMGGYNDMSDLDVAWNLEREGQNIGRLESDNWILRGAPYVVDPELRPGFGTAEYERMLRSEIEDVRSAISGSAIDQGAERDVGRLLGDYILGSDGTYDAYAQEMQASQAARGGDPQAYYAQLMEQMWLEQMLGGIPEYHGNFDSAMSSTQMMQELLAQQAGWQNELGAAQNPVQTFIPNFQQPQIDPTMLVDQVLRGNNPNGLTNPGRSRLDRFNLGGDQRARGAFANDPGAALLQHRMLDTQLTGSGGLDIDPQRAEELGAELRLRVDGDNLSNEDVDRLAGLTTDERVSVLSQLSPAQLRSLGDQLPDQDDDKSGKFLARLAEDAQTHPELVRGQFGHILDGINDDDSNDSDDVLHEMQRELGGGDVGEEANATRAADALAHLGHENLDKMVPKHESGNRDDKELDVIARARGVINGASPEGAALTSEASKQVRDGDVEGDLIDRFTNASREDRLAALGSLTTEERQKFAEDGTYDEEQMGNLMASLVQDAQADPRAQIILRDFMHGIQTNGSSDSDDVLHQMQRNLGGGDVENSDNRRRAARALAGVHPEILDVMTQIHEGGNRDDKELEVIALARQLQ